VLRWKTPPLRFAGSPFDPFDKLRDRGSGHRPSRGRFVVLSPFLSPAGSRSASYSSLEGGAERSEAEGVGRVRRTPPPGWRREPPQGGGFSRGRSFRPLGPFDGPFDRLRMPLRDRGSAVYDLAGGVVLGVEW